MSFRRAFTFSFLLFCAFFESPIVFANDCPEVIRLCGEADLQIKKIEEFRIALKKEDEKFATVSDMSAEEIAAIRIAEKLPPEIQDHTVLDFYLSRVRALTRVIAEIRGNFYSKIVLSKINTDDFFQDIHTELDGWNKNLKLVRADDPSPEILRSLLTKILERTSVTSISAMDLRNIILSGIALKLLDKIYLDEHKSRMNGAVFNSEAAKNDSQFLRPKADELMQTIPKELKDLDIFNDVLRRIAEDDELFVEACCLKACWNCPYARGLKRTFGVTPVNVPTSSSPTLIYYRAVSELKEILPAQAFAIEMNPSHFKRKLVQIRMTK